MPFPGTARGTVPGRLVPSRGFLAPVSGEQARANASLALESPGVSKGSDPFDTLARARFWSWRRRVLRAGRGVGCAQLGTKRTKWQGGRLFPSVRSGLCALPCGGHGCPVRFPVAARAERASRRFATCFRAVGGHAFPGVRLATWHYPCPALLRFINHGTLFPFADATSASQCTPNRKCGPAAHR